MALGSLLILDLLQNDVRQSALLKAICMRGLHAHNAHLSALAPMMLRCVTVKTFKLVEEMRKKDSFGVQDLSCTYLAHHELESVIVTIYYYAHSQKCNQATRQCLKSDWTKDDNDLQAEIETQLYVTANVLQSSLWRMWNIPLEPSTPSMLCLQFIVDSMSLSRGTVCLSLVSHGQTCCLLDRRVPPRPRQPAISALTISHSAMQAWPALCQVCFSCLITQDSLA